MDPNIRPCSPFPFHILSFEGPDAYARAGGIASRITGLAQALADQGSPTSLWFVGDPKLPGREQRNGVTMYRWCQWISQYHPAGAYDGEQHKVRDYARSLPPHLLDILRKDIANYGTAAVLAEEWHTVDAVLHLDHLLRAARLREQVVILWNANNTFGFGAIDWQRLNRAATITTVSRYMRTTLLRYGVSPLVVHNGLGPDAFAQPSQQAVVDLRGQVNGRMLLTKIARWDPDKRWLLAVDTVAHLKQINARPLLVARGGVEHHGHEVLERARQAGLTIKECHLSDGSESAVLQGLSQAPNTDLLLVRSHIGAPARALLFQASGAVLANSSHEPFGLVGLETMAVGGLACLGATGEDYAQPGKNALVLDKDDPTEFARLYLNLQKRPGAEAQLRAMGVQTAKQYTWRDIVECQLLPHAQAQAPLKWPAKTRANPKESKSARRPTPTLRAPTASTVHNGFSVFGSHGSHVERLRTHSS